MIAGLLGDLLVFSLLVIILYLCFGGGIVRVTSVLVASYGALQMAAYLYVPLANFTATPGDPNSLQVNHIVWFGAVWLVGTIALTVAALLVTRYIELPGVLGRLDQVGGVTLGLVLAIFILLIGTLVLRETLYIIWYTSGKKQDLIGFIREAFTNSFLVGLFKQIASPLLDILAPWLPKNIPILNLQS